MLARRFIKVQERIHNALPHGPKPLDGHLAILDVRRMSPFAVLS